MNPPAFDKDLKLKEVIRGFCGNPTPFKIIATLNADDSVQHALDVFMKSDSKRKVLAIETHDGKTFHLGYNELIGILNRYLNQD